MNFALALFIVAISHAAGFFVGQKRNGALSLSSQQIARTMRISRTLLQSSTEATESPNKWVIDGGDTSETECSSSTDVARGTAAPPAAMQVKAVTPASIATSITTPAPKVDMTKLSVGTDSFDVGLLIAFPIMIATLGFFFLFPLIGPQFASTLPPVPPM